MVRVVRLAGGGLAVGRTLPGRGAWLCPASPGCVDQAVKRRAFGRALRGEVGNAQVDQLRTTLLSGRGEPEGKSGLGSGGPVL